VLARRWRPQTFEQMVGQEHVLRAMVNALSQNRLHHAYLLTGTRGVGKTTLARLIAKCLNCETGVSATPCGTCSACTEIAQGRFVDLIEVDAASRTKVEDTRELLDNVQYAPTRGRYKVYLIDEVHMLSTHSFNALLKTLEEPPPHVKFLLATTDPQKLPATVLSRCLQFHLKNLSPEQIAGHLANILKQEEIRFEESALWDLGRAAEGSMRDALSLTDQAIAHGSNEVTAEGVSQMLGYVDRELLKALVDALIDMNAAALLQAVSSLAEHATDFERVLGDLLGVLHRIAMAQAVPDALDNHHGDREQVADWATRISAADLQLFYQVGLHSRRDFAYAPDARSGLEMALLRMIAFRPAGAAPPPEVSAKKPEPEPAAARQSAPEARVESTVLAKTQPTSAPVPPSTPLAAAREPKPEPDEPERSEIQPDEPPEQTAQSEVRVPARLEEVNALNWPLLLELLDVGGIARTVAMHAVPTLSASESIAFTLESRAAIMHNAQCDERLASALVAYFGTPCVVSMTHGDVDSETPAARISRLALERQQRAETSIDTDPNVRMLLERFGGRVLRDTIRPVDTPPEQTETRER